MTRTYFQTFNRLDEAETDITVEYSFSPGSPATWDDPAEGAEVEIIKAWVGDDFDIGEVSLTFAETDKFKQWLSENHEDDGEPDYDYHRDTNE